MKKLFFLLIVISMALSLTGCASSGGTSKKTSSASSSSISSSVAATSSSTLTAEQAEKANTVESLLKLYKTVTYSQLDYIGGNTTHIIFFKNESGSPCVIEDDNGYTSYRTDAFSFVRENGKSEYRLFAAKHANVSEYLLMVSGSKITTQTVNSNGNLVCETLTDINKDYADELSDWKVTTADKMLTTAVFASNDNRVLSIDFTIRHSGGSTLKIASGVALYNQKVQYPDMVQNYLNAKKCTVTVQMADGSKRIAQIPKGEKFSFDCDDGYTLYADAAGKTPVPKESAPVEKDMTLYVLKAQS